MQRKISSLQIWSGRFEEERNLLPMSVIKPWWRRCPHHSTVNIPTTQTQLLAWHIVTNSMEARSYKDGKTNFPPKRWYLPTKGHDITSQKTILCIFNLMANSHLKHTVPFTENFGIRYYKFLSGISTRLAKFNNVS
jgi:hypothetical protein